jgi:hypothetical protein
MLVKLILILNSYTDGFINYAAPLIRIKIDLHLIVATLVLVRIKRLLGQILVVVELLECHSRRFFVLKTIIQEA